MPYRIHKLVTEDGIVFEVSGDIQLEQMVHLEELLATEPPGIVLLDLKHVTLVDRAAVRVLAGTESSTVRIVNCPEYVRRWIIAERAAMGKGRGAVSL